MKSQSLVLRSNIAALTCVSALLLTGTSLLQAADADKPAAPAAAPAAEPRLFGGVVAEAVKETATVEKINYETREVTLLGSKGNVRTLIAGPEVKRLAEIKQGDTIEAVYVESVVVLAGDSAGAPAREDSTEIVRADKSQKPGGAIVQTVRVLATVTAIDYKARTATLKGPQRTVTLNVGPEAVNFEKVKVGDSVYLEFTQALAMAVTKSAAAK